MKYFSFLKVFLKYFILLNTTLLCKKMELFFTSNTVNDSMIGKQATMIILCFMYASLELKKHIALQTERLSNEPSNLASPLQSYLLLPTVYGLVD